VSAVLFALAGALSYGTSDFIGGLMSRRAALWPTALTACTGALMGSAVLALALPGSPAPEHFAWGLLAGVGSGVGTGFLYRGMASGRMSVVAPISAVGAAALPVLVGLLGGERPGPVVWLGIVVAFPAIWMVASQGPALAVADRGGRVPPGVLDGVVAGLGFGLGFTGLAQVPAGAGYWPLAAAQVMSVASVAAMCYLLGGSLWPRRASEFTGLISGFLASLAIWLFLLATHRGMLTVSSVVVSLYPAATVAMAIALLREHVYRTQAIGLALCAVTVALVATG